LASGILKNLLNFLAITFFLIACVFFFGSESPDDSCDVDWTPECEKQDEEFGEDSVICCISFIIMLVFVAWAKNIQDKENLEAHAEMARQFQETRIIAEAQERERAKVEQAEREELLQKRKEYLMKKDEEVKAAEKLRLQKEIEELEASLDE
tara:strand:+ start:97 stop:552 length:456 start_codon:yes stop_codon:yes gene_type:complete